MGPKTNARGNSLGVGLDHAGPINFVGSGVHVIAVLTHLVDATEEAVATLERSRRTEHTLERVVAKEGVELRVRIWSSLISHVVLDDGPRVGVGRQQD